MILALFLVSLTVMELILRSERKQSEQTQDKREIAPQAEKLRDAHLVRLEAPVTSAPAALSGMAADLLALADAMPNEAPVELRGACAV